MATHQRQPEPEFVVAPQGSNGAADLRGIQLIEASEVLQDLHQGQEGLPVAVGPLMQQLLPFSDLQLQIFHAPAMLLQLFAISPAMGRMLLLLLLEIRTSRAWVNTSPARSYCGVVMSWRRAMWATANAKPPLA